MGSLGIFIERPSEILVNHKCKTLSQTLSAWTMDPFEHIRNNCGGFIGVEEDTKNITHFHWASICVINSAKN